MSELVEFEVGDYRGASASASASEALAEALAQLSAAAGAVLAGTGAEGSGSP